MTTKRRILKNNDGSVSVIIPAPKSRRKEETEQEWLDRVFNKATPNNIDFEDVDVSDMPNSREDRDCWKFDKLDKKVKVCPIKKAAKEQLKLEKENKKNILKSKLKLSDEELKILKSML